MSEPTTAAGKALLNAFHFPGGDAIVAGQYVSWHLAAIEDEAREPWRADANRLALNLRNVAMEMHQTGNSKWHHPPGPRFIEGTFEECVDPDCTVAREALRLHDEATR